MWNTSVPLVGLILSPVTLLAGPVMSYVLLTSVTCAINSIAAERAASRFVTKPGLAWLGGLLYGFSPYVVNHLTVHPNLALIPYPCILLAALTDFLRGRWSSRRTGVVLGISTVVQFFVGEEVLLDSWLAASIGLGYLAAANLGALKDSWAKLTRAAAWIGMVCLPLLAYPLWLQLAGPQHIAAPLRSVRLFPGEDLGNFLLPNSMTALPSPLDIANHFFRNPYEDSAYLGVLPFLALVSLASRRRRAAETALAASAVGTALLSLGSSPSALGVRLDFSWMPWRIVQALPVVGDLLPTRLPLGVDLCVTLLAVGGLERLAEARDADRGHHSYLKRLGTAGLAVAAVALFIPRLPLPSTRALIPEFFRSGASSVPAGCIALVAPIPYSFTSDDAMLWQAVAGFRFKLVDGYAMTPLRPGQRTQFSPLPDPLVSYLMDAQGRRGKKLGNAFVGVVPHVGPHLEAAKAQLERSDVCALVVGDPGAHPVLLKAVEALAGAPSVARGGAVVWTLHR